MLEQKQPSTYFYHKENLMNDSKTFQHITAITLITVALLIVASTIVLLMAVDFNPKFMSHPEGLITIGASASETFRWGTILELGYTILFLPAVLYLWYWLKPQAHRLASLYTVFGLAGLMSALIGVLLRTTLYPPLINAYPQTPEIQRDTLVVIFQGLTDFNFKGLWALELIFWGIWWLGIGPLLRSERRILGNVTMILGIVYLVAGAGWFLRIEPLARLENVFFFVPFWTVWLGIVIWRRDEKREQMMEATTTV
jgi:hypothetical protein